MEPNSAILKTIETSEYKMNLCSDNIVYVTFKRGSEIDIGYQERLLEAYLNITEGKKHAFLFDAEDDVTVTKEGRDNAIKMESRSPVAATAVVVNSVPYTLIANFYLKFNKPKHPYKVFKNRKDALAWLKGHKIEGYVEKKD